MNSISGLSSSFSADDFPSPLRCLRKSATSIGAPEAGEEGALAIDA